jgi:uncharacterized protein involved in exopolysaccharide biosynthesis
MSVANSLSERTSGQSTALTPDGDATMRMSLIGLLEILARHLRVLVAVPLLIAALAVLYVLMVGRTYRAESSFAPEAPSGAMQRVAGLAAEFGLSFGNNNGAESVDFYADLVRSRTILEQVVKQRYVAGPSQALGSKADSGTLVDIYHSSGETEQDRVNSAIQRLGSDLSVRAAPRSNLVHVYVVAPSRGLAETINANVLQAVSDFNVAKRQTRAASERAFVAQRLQLAQQELQSAEGALESFLQRNRRYQDSPQLVVEFGRLQRRVELRQQVANSLAQAFEQSRIEEVRNTPVITILEHPESAAKPARTLRQAALLGGFLGGLLTLGLVLAFELLETQSALDPEANERVREQVRSLLRLGRRRQPV